MFSKLAMLVAFAPSFFAICCVFFPKGRIFQHGGGQVIPFVDREHSEHCTVIEGTKLIVSASQNR